MTNVKSPKKLIEVALPLDKINEAAAREKSIRHGHPSTLHLWWARRPLAAARAVLFAQMVNDPGGERGYFAGMTKAQAAAKREELFKIVEDLVKWESSSDEEVLGRARAAILESWRETCRLNRGHPDASTLFNPEVLPAFHDPFAGGGALPLEAQRLGLDSYASDLNPVAVTINKAMIEIPHRFRDRPPIGPFDLSDRQSKLHEDWGGFGGLAEDIRRYAAWMQDQARTRLGHLYPDFEITEQVVGDPKNPRPDLKPFLGQKLPVIAWLWARTVESPNPAFSGSEVPLVTTFVLSKKPGKQSYVEVVVSENKYLFRVKAGAPPVEAESGTKANGRGANFYCVLSRSPIGADYIRAAGKANRIGSRLMAVVAEAPHGRLYLSPTEEQERAASSAIAGWAPEVEFFQQALGFRVGNYGLSRWSQLFTGRQLMALSTISDLIEEVRQRCARDAREAGMTGDNHTLESGGNGPEAYGEAIATYLAFFLSRMVNLNNAFCQWRNDPAKEHVGHLFTRQAIPMVWDFAEANPLGGSAGGFRKTLDFVPKVLPFLATRGTQGFATQANASEQTISSLKVISTDPPYYDNIGYADLSDFFYVWLRRSLRPVFPQLFATMAVPKAEAFFLDGMTQAMGRLAELAHPAFPVTIYYAFKQAETSGDSGTHSTGWETFLEAVLRAGFALTGTWPMRTELSNRMRGTGSNALASSIVLVCRKRLADAGSTSRREFIRELNSALPDALDEMTRDGVNSPVAPVDLSQAIIGPGMAIFSRYASVLEADGTPMSVRTALQLINRFLSEDDFDADSQFCLHWFETLGWAVGKFGDADVLARAKGTSVRGLADAGVLESSGGQVRLLRWREYPNTWSPEHDDRAAIWEMLHHLTRTSNVDGESAAGALLARMMDKAEPIRALAYRLYTLCERKGWADDARSYNEIITSWQGIEAAANEVGPRGTQVILDI